MTVDAAGLRNIATECVNIVAAEFDQTLDWRLESLETLDKLCARLLSAGPLDADRRDLWWKLVGAYTGEVILATYGGEWISHENAPGSYAILVDSVTGFPFALADRVLGGEPFKSLASFGRAFPHIARRTMP
jgi:hypothetical protein